MTREFELYASLLSGDAGRLAETVRELEDSKAVDGLHIDVMDGRFVPNLAFGPQAVAALRSVTNLPMEIHLMVEEPHHLLPIFAHAGAQRLIVHVEACAQLHRELATIEKLGLQRGVALNPATSISSIEWSVDEIDEVLLMGVDPGFGGQALIATTAAKVRATRAVLEAHGSRASIIVDGGVKRENAAMLARCGSNRLVVGSALFTGSSIAHNAQSFNDLPVSESC